MFVVRWLTSVIEDKMKKYIAFNGINYSEYSAYTDKDALDKALPSSYVFKKDEEALKRGDPRERWLTWVGVKPNS